MPECHLEKQQNIGSYSVEYWKYENLSKCSHMSSPMVQVLVEWKDEFVDLNKYFMFYLCRKCAKVYFLHKNPFM